METAPKLIDMAAINAQLQKQLEEAAKAEKAMNDALKAAVKKVQ